MFEELRKGWRAVDTARDVVDAGRKVSIVVSAESGDRSRVFAQELSALIGSLVGGSAGTAAGAELGTLVSPVGSLVGAGLGGIAGGFAGEQLGRYIVSSVYEHHSEPGEPEPVTIASHPYH